MVIEGLFRKESHYLWALVVLVFMHVLFMSYLFPLPWAETPLALAFVDQVATLVPSLRRMQQHVPAPIHYWGMFYAIFWVLAPIYWVLGFAGSFFLSPSRYQNFVVRMRLSQILSVLLIFTGCALFIFEIPMPLTGIYSDQMSQFLPKLLLFWGACAGVFYLQARGVAALILKFNLSRHHYHP